MVMGIEDMEYIQLASTWVLGLLVSGGVFTVFAFWLFRLLGEKWLNNRFSRNLEDLRHKQAGEIERFRFQISTLLDRASKVHQREYEVLPELWDALIEADSYVQAAVGSFKSYPDVTFASADVLDEILSNTERPEITKSEIRSKTGHDRQKGLQR